LTQMPYMSLIVKSGFQGMLSRRLSRNRFDLKR
jgi:hypothetical protein